MALTCPVSYTDADANREIPCQHRHHPEGLHHAHDGTRCIMWTDGATAINSASMCPHPPAHEAEQRATELSAKVKAARRAATPAPGPCPVSPCDWDLEGTLDEHLYCDHEAEDLASTLVRIALDNDRLRAENERLADVLNADDQPLLCPNCVCADCGGREGQHAPGGACSCGCRPACDRFQPDSQLDVLRNAVAPLLGDHPLAEAAAHRVWHALNPTRAEED